MALPEGLTGEIIIDAILIRLADLWGGQRTSCLEILRL
jgi:hypothetical protein